jgi:hypothetical protein
LLTLAEKLHRFLSAERPNVTVDTFVPFSKLLDFFAWYERAIDFFPVWIVPYRRVRDFFAILFENVPRAAWPG